MPHTHINKLFVSRQLCMKLTMSIKLTKNMVMKHLSTITLKAPHCHCHYLVHHVLLTQTSIAYNLLLSYLSTGKFFSSYHLHRAA